MSLDLHRIFAEECLISAQHPNLHLAPGLEPRRISGRERVDILDLSLSPGQVDGGDDVNQRAPCALSLDRGNLWDTLIGSTAGHSYLDRKMSQHWAGRENVLGREPGPDSVVRVIAQPLIVAVTS